MRIAHVAQRRIQRGDSHAAAVRQAQANRVNLVLDGPRLQGFVGGAGQRAGNNVNLIGRGHTQAIFLHHRQGKLFHQFIDQATAAVNDHQRALMLLTVAVQCGKQTLQRLFTV
ncbi:hypothetical protein D3C79_891070 [compost metagenome]